MKLLRRKGRGAAIMESNDIGQEMNKNPHVRRRVETRKRRERVGGQVKEVDFEGAELWLELWRSVTGLRINLEMF